MKLIMKGIAFLLTGLVVMGALFFLSAGTFGYWNGWLMLGILFIPMLLMGLVLLVKDRLLLEKRLQLKEKQTTQKGVVALSGLMFLAGFVLAGLDFRFGWLPLPKAVSVIAAVVFLAGYGMYAEVLRENTYLSRTVE
ncbi:MAG: isoprenylcysteine carboxylmethyltransferase family protein, partial [Oscillospiraceae bacterium]|nr:isoprenylcysteine carboxylmethyltransferase family protein [Oscillospiraceae bacterium]